MPLTIEWRPAGKNGTVMLTAILDGQTIHADKLDIGRATARERFARALVQREPRLKTDDVDTELLAIADQCCTPPQATTDELDVSAIVRPELFFHADVAGIAVPTATISNGQPAGKWYQYLKWSDGHRERRELSAYIELPDGRRLWFSPVPAPPAPTQPAGWSAQSRTAWLAGAEAPEPATVFRRICEAIAWFVDFPPESAAGDTALLALWSMFTYIYPNWPAVPYLSVGGPLGSGKSRVFELLNRLAFRPMASSNMTAPTLFRSLHESGGTLLLDEAERLRDSTPDAAELRSILLSGYKRGSGARRLEASGDGKFVARTFDVFGPKALAAIATLPEALASRCIRLLMFRSRPDSPKPRRHIDVVPERWTALRNDLHALTLEHAADWPALAARGDVCPSMSGRDYELWQPMLALAGWLDDHGAAGLLSIMQQHAAKLIALSKDDATPDSDELLLRLLAVAVVAGTAHVLEPDELLKQAQAKEPALFQKWSVRGISNTLKRYGITSTKSHSRRTYRDVSPAQLRRVEVSYDLDLGLPEAVRTLAGEA